MWENVQRRRQDWFWSFPWNEGGRIFPACPGSHSFPLPGLVNRIERCLHNLRSVSVPNDAVTAQLWKKQNQDLLWLWNQTLRLLGQRSGKWVTSRSFLQLSAFYFKTVTYCWHLCLNSELFLSFMCVYVCLCAYVHVVYIYVCVHCVLYVYVYICVSYVCICVCTVYMYVLYVFVCICAYVCMCSVYSIFVQFDYV